MAADLTGTQNHGVDPRAAQPDRGQETGAQYLRAMLRLLIGAQGLKGATGDGLRVRIGMNLRF